MHIQLIIASVRPTRIGDQIAQWAIDLASGIDDLTFELVDLKDWYLPLDDEPHQPKVGGYVQHHTMAWSEQIRKGDGYIFLTPQYNWGYPASLKNALDHLYHEWSNKPAVIVTYGHRGGVKAAEQLKQVLIGLHMRPVPLMPALVIKHDMLDENGRLTDPSGSFASYEQQVVEAIGALVPEGHAASSATAGAAAAH